MCFCFQLVGQTQVGESGSPIFFKNGQVGIGNSDPLAKLHITNNNHSYAAILAQADERSFQLYAKTLTTQPSYVESFRIGLKHGTNENNGYISFYRGGSVDGGFLGFGTNGVERMSIVKNGNVGIGVSNPLYKLHVDDHSDTANPCLALFSGYNLSGLYQDRFNRIAIVNRNGQQVWLGIEGSGDNAVGYLGVEHQTGGANQIIAWNKAGAVGIGTNSPTERLDVHGTIKATEIKVEAQTADFVFEDDYQLKSLEEVEQFVQANKHLPDIPSAKQMEEEGVGLAEMNKLLLQKVEELTLYLIQKDNEVTELRKEIEIIKNQIK